MTNPNAPMSLAEAVAYYDGRAMLANSKPAQAWAVIRQQLATAAMQPGNALNPGALGHEGRVPVWVDEADWKAICERRGPAWAGGLDAASFRALIRLGTVDGHSGQTPSVTVPSSDRASEASCGCAECENMRGGRPDGPSAESPKADVFTKRLIAHAMKDTSWQFLLEGRPLNPSEILDRLNETLVFDGEYYVDMVEAYEQALKEGWNEEQAMGCALRAYHAKAPHADT